MSCTTRWKNIAGNELAKNLPTRLPQKIMDFKNKNKNYLVLHLCLLVFTPFSLYSLLYPAATCYQHLCLIWCCWPQEHPTVLTIFCEGHIAHRNARNRLVIRNCLVRMWKLPRCSQCCIQVHHFVKFFKWSWGRDRERHKISIVRRRKILWNSTPSYAVQFHCRSSCRKRSRNEKEKIEQKAKEFEIAWTN